MSNLYLVQYANYEDAIISESKQEAVREFTQSLISNPELEIDYVDPSDVTCSILYKVE
jgi:hypothetical protein